MRSDLLDLPLSVLPIVFGLTFGLPIANPWPLTAFTDRYFQLANGNFYGFHILLSHCCYKTPSFLKKTPHGDINFKKGVANLTDIPIFKSVATCHYAAKCGILNICRTFRHSQRRRHGR
jgi:hypothetical protein